MKNLMIVVLIFVVFALACDESGNMNEGPSGLANNGRDNSNQARRSNANVIPPTTESNDDDTGFVISQTGEEKVKPDEGRANVQGKVLYNSQPAADIEVKLCEKLNIETLACTGKSFKTRTDSSGEFLLANVPPIVYDSLLVRVFETNLYLFSTRKPGKAAKYKLEPD